LLFEKTLTPAAAVFAVAVDAKIFGNIIPEQIILNVWKLIFSDIQYHHPQ
jgi:hypothetical protein